MGSLNKRPRLVVVGAGIAGLAAARAAVDAYPDMDVIVLERSSRIGGLIETEHTPDGFVVEHGADCLLTTKPAGLALARRMGLGDELVAGGEGPKTTFLARRTRLLPLPAGVAFGVPSAVMELLRSPVLSLSAKLRMGLEPFLSPGRGAPSGTDDESIAAFIERRFGRELLERVIEPLLGGIHGAPAAELSLRACLPKLAELERTHGSVVLGMRQQRQSIRAGKRGSSPAPPPSSVVSLLRGMGSLPDAVAHSLGDRVHLGKSVRDIVRRPGGGFRIRLAGGESIDADGVVVAAPAHAAAPMFERLSPALATLLARVRHGRLDCVTLGYRREHVSHPLAGTGFVVAPSEGRPTRACSWSSVKWPGRAPEGSVLMRSVLHAPDASDDELVEAARRDLRELMGVDRNPSVIRVRRRNQGLPTYEVGYLHRLESMRHEAASLGAVALAGNAQGGIGVPDCIQSGLEAAGAVLGAMRLAPTAARHPMRRSATGIGGPA